MPLVYIKPKALVECPKCNVFYPVEQTGMKYKKGMRASVRCSICRVEFEVRIQPRFFFWKKVIVNTRIR